jgi:hypothetical protein
MGLAADTSGGGSGIPGARRRMDGRSLPSALSGGSLPAFCSSAAVKGQSKSPTDSGEKSTGSDAKRGLLMGMSEMGLWGES